jgi:hypothetical protein
VITSMDSSPQEQAVTTQASSHTPVWYRILVVDSGRDLFKYKSFFLLIFVLALIDKLLKKYVKLDRSSLPTIQEMSIQSADYVFTGLPADVLALISDYRTFLVLAALFMFKETISLWPSSDMRRMHRNERGRFGIFASLTAIRWQQVGWDIIAVGATCGVFMLWAVSGFVLWRGGWQILANPWWLVLFAMQVGLALPLVMAGFSFSSKLAVISRGAFSAKLALFFKLFTSARLAVLSWIFFTGRIVLESIFVVGLPALILFSVDHLILRLVLATMIATPSYCYLKMASFKFFLMVYRPYQLVHNEYRHYYQRLYET